MNSDPIVDVIIPAFNEEGAIAKVINEIPQLVRDVIVVNNNSTDNTAQVAESAGATVVLQPKSGYGWSCLKGMELIANKEISPDIVVFLDGDHSDFPQELTKLIDPIINENIDFVIGARAKDLREPGSLTPQQAFGNWLATSLMKLFFNSRFTDLGPFRAIKHNKLLELNMEDKTYGWTVEMQLKALKQGLSYREIPVKYRNRIGVSKVSGTLKGTIFAESRF